jgi:hypothetical protein
MDRQELIARVDALYLLAVVVRDDVRQALEARDDADRWEPPELEVVS